MSEPAPDRLDALLDQASELARLLMKSSQPPRALTSEFLHGRKRFTAEEKALISSMAHHALRCWRLAAAAASGVRGEVNPRDDASRAGEVLAASLLLALPDHSPLTPPLPFPPELRDENVSDDAIGGAALRLLQRTGGGTVDALLQHARDLESDAAAGGDAGEAFDARWSLPGWMTAAWRWDAGTDDATRFEMDVIVDIGFSLMHAAPFTLRVNHMRCSREELIARLQSEGAEAEAHPLLQDAAIVRKRAQLTDGPAYVDGCFEVQDAGSQLIALAAGVVPGQQVYDACAGGGGKTMQLADLMRDDGALLASDIERNKLRGLRQRAARLGLRSLSTLAVTPYGDAQNPEQEPLPADASFDCVLVDAPCSGAGTLRRNPALKWRLNEKTVDRLARRQFAILRNNARYVRPGGTLIYATCSLLPQENAEIVAHFLRDARRDGMEFDGDPLLSAFAQADFHPPIPTDCWQWTIPPSLLNSDGYFVARMRRRP